MPSIDEVHVLSTYVESIFYGIFVVMYMACVWVLVKRQDPIHGKVHKPMLLTATAMMIVATLFEAVSIQRDVEAFWEHKDGSPVAYYNDWANFAELYQSGLWLLQVLIGDSLLIYRMYIVYSRRLIIIALPFTFLLASMGCGSYSTPYYHILSSPSAQAPWATVIVVLTMSQNLISTTAIALRLWWLGRSPNSGFSGRYSRSMTVFLESGLPYTIMLIIFTALHLSDQTLYDIAYYSLVPILGISLTGLIIRVGLRRRVEVITSGADSRHESTLPYKHRRRFRPTRLPTFAVPNLSRTQDSTVYSTDRVTTARGDSELVLNGDLEKAELPHMRSFQTMSTMPVMPPMTGGRDAVALEDVPKEPLSSEPDTSDSSSSSETPAHPTQ